MPNKWKVIVGLIVICIFTIGIKGYSLFRATWPIAIVYWQTSDEKNQDVIEHSVFNEFLSPYLHDNKRLRTFNYNAVTLQDKHKLTTYLTYLQTLDPRIYTKDEQLAYWVNLYNALVINLVLTHYPIDSIKEIGDGFTGPWNIQLATIAGQPITLNKIEHGILRPIWQDNRIHYVINCASIGCPDLPLTTFTSVNIDQQLNAAATRFINQPKAVSIVNDTLTFSGIYTWFSADFGSSHSALMAHINTYALPPLKKQLNSFSGDIEFDYDWALNEENNNSD